MKTIHPAPLLKFALVADAIVSGAVAVLQVALPAQLSGMLALPRPLLQYTGEFLLAYTALLALRAASSSVPRALVLLLAAGNIGWAIGCAGVLVELSPSAPGIAFVVVQLAAVLVFAALQSAGVKASVPAVMEGEPA